VELRRQELIRVSARGGCGAREIAVDAWEEEGISRDLTGRSLGRQIDGCGRTARSGSGDNLSSDKSEFLRKRNPKEGEEWMQR
jgi:hypothetical protein